MTALFIGTDYNIFSMFMVLLQTKFHCECIQCFDVNSSVEILEENSNGNEISLIILSLPIDNPISLFKYLKNKKLEIPLLFTADLTTLHEVQSLIPYHSLCSRVSYNVDSTIIVQAIKRLIKIKERKVKSIESFHPLPTSFFLESTKAKCDIFIKLSKIKYVRLWKKGHNIDKHDILKYRDKNCDFFHLKTSDYFRIADGFLEQVIQKIPINKMNSSLLTRLSKFTHQSVIRMVQEIGLSPDVLNHADKAIAFAEESVARDKLLAKYLKNILNKKGHNSDRTMMIVFLSIAIAKSMDLSSKKIFQKITYAGLFRDLCVTPKEEKIFYFTRISSLESVTNLKSYDQYKEHSQKAVDLLSQIDGIPLDVERMILMHHESPRGTGFPFGRNWKNIDPLVALFIVAEDVVSMIYQDDVNEEFIEEIIDELEEKYRKGHFKKVYKALRKALCLCSPHSNNIKIINTCKNDKSSKTPRAA